MNIYTVATITALFFGLILQLWLFLRQEKYVFQHRNNVPELFRGHISLESHQKAADYTIAKTHLLLIEEIFTALVFLFWTIGGSLNSLDNFWRAYISTPIWIGAAFIISFSLSMSILDLPLAIYRTFIIEERFGFNRTTPRLFVTDTIKQLILFVLFGTPLACIVLWLMETAGENWWIYTWCVWMTFIVFMTWTFPTFIAPLFNKFTPLVDEEIRVRVTSLVERCGFHTDAIHVMDSSRRSTHGNAYFTGFGQNKRIVFFDTLVKCLSPDQIETVLAHELGHFSYRHVFKRWLVIGTMSLIGLSILGYLRHDPLFFFGLGVEFPSSHTALILFILVTPLFTLFIQPFLSHFLRQHEFEADRFSCQTTGKPQALKEALLNLYQENAGTLTPDPLYSAFYDSHPPAVIRLSQIILLENQA